MAIRAKSGSGSKSKNQRLKPKSPPAGNSTKVPDPSGTSISEEELNRLLAEDKAEKEARDASKGLRSLIIRDGEDKQIVIRHTTPVVAGKFHVQWSDSGYIRVPCTLDSSGSCMMCEAGWQSRPQYVYEFVDESGFTNKKGEEVAHFSCLYWASSTRARVLFKLLGADGDVADRLSEKGLNIDDITFKMSRVGSGPDTTHYFQADFKTPASEESKQAESLAEKASRILTEPWSDIACHKAIATWKAKNAGKSFLD